MTRSTGSRYSLEQKEAIRSLFLQGVPVSQIARIIECSGNTVKRSTQDLSRPKIVHRGDKHWNWQGGIKWTAGYCYLHIDGWYQKRANLVLEKKLGRRLLPGEIAHHINEDRSDDSPDNLEVKSFTTHQAEHNHERAERGVYRGAHAHQPRDESGKFS